MSETNYPLVNVITRFSRKETIQRCLDSVYNQTYPNIHHIITYEREEDRPFLESKVPSITTLIKVCPLKEIKKLAYSYNHHDYYTNILNPDYNFIDKKPYDVENNKEDLKIKIKVDPVRFEKNGRYCVTLGKTYRMAVGHFPYNLYFRYVEKFVKPGWVFYLDDDDNIIDSNSIQELVSDIVKTDEDTLQIVKTRVGNAYRPNQTIFQNMETGYPPVLGGVGSCNMIFHTKYYGYTMWDEWRAADWRTFRCLYDVIPKHNFINKAFIQVNV